MDTTKTPAAVHPLLVGITPGPWQIEPEFPLEVHKGYSIAKASPSFRYEGEAEANAKLIAAAPTLAAENAKMKAALERAVSELHAMRRDDAMKWTDDFDKATAHADGTVSDYREVLASLPTP